MCVPLIEHDEGIRKPKPNNETNNESYPKHCFIYRIIHWFKKLFRY
jgi:hypothetical protein